MTDYEHISVLIPCHSLEDFPTELGDQHAEGLLNAFAVMWHPRLLASAGAFPRWRRADEPEQPAAAGLYLVPAASEGWLPHGWIEQAREAGSVVVAGAANREEMLAAAVKPLPSEQTVEPDLAADFLALGVCYLQTELLTRHMRNFSNVDEVHLQREAVAAAKAAVSDDRVAAETHLRYCFEMLLEQRERFYPVDCYLIDLCLVIPRLAENFAEFLERTRTPINLLATTRDLTEIISDQPEARRRLRAGWDAGRVEVLGGEWSETCTPLMSVQSVIWELSRGLRAAEASCGKRPHTWARRRYGVGPHMPQLLSKFGFTSAMHVVLDDGLYPDDEQSQLRWEGADGSVVNATSRIPLAADGASSILRFPVRMAESMDHDHSAAVIFARWPELRSPWLEDFHRMHKYAPVLGRFITFREFFEGADVPGRLSNFSPGEYLTPFLVQSAAREEAAAVSRYVDYWRRRRDYEAGEWTDHVAQLLRQGRIEPEQHRGREETIEQATPEATGELQSAADEAVTGLSAAGGRALADLLATDAAAGPGMLLVNPLSFTRQLAVDWPAEAPLPAVGGAVKATQSDEVGRMVRVEVPGCGFVWIPRTEATVPAAPEKTPTAEDLLLRNEFFEVTLSDVTGGIAQIRTYRRSPNRASQQIAFRFPHERTVTVGEGADAEQYRTYYSEMRMEAHRILRNGSVVGEIETTGGLFDPQGGERLADYRQTTRIRRGSPVLEFEIELQPERLAEGNPWLSYYAVRFAWKYSTVTLSRSMHHGVHPVTGERFEAPQFIELADEDDRTTLVPFGAPFHRKTGERMLDSIVLPPGETRTRFRFAIVVDDPYPLASALDATSPAICVPTESGPPGGLTSGWFFHVSSRNVQLTRVLPLDERTTATDDAAADVQGCRLRLMETEGRRKQVTLRCFRSVASARQCDFLGETLRTLAVEGDAVSLDVGRFEICDVELRFEA